MTKKMTQGSPIRLILGFTLPLLAGMLFQQLYNLVDTLIVGRFLGINALAGVGSTASITFLVLGFCMGVCSGFSIPVARSFGAGDQLRLRQYVVNGSLLAAGFAVVMTVVTMLLCRTILQIMGTPAECIEEAYTYLQVIFAGIPAAFLYNLLSGYLQALGDSRTPLFFLVFSSIVNVALDLFTILNLNMGVFGAALATVVSQALSGMLCLLWIRRRYPVLRFGRSDLVVRKDRMAELCRNGVPMGLQYSITAIGNVVLQAGMNSLGAAAVAASTAGTKISMFLACLPNALGTTMATYCAQNVGAGRDDRLTPGVISASLLGFGYTLLALGIALVAGVPLSTLFLNGEDAARLAGMAQQYLLINVIAYPLLTLVNVVRCSIQGMGFSLFSICSGIMEMIARTLAGVVLIPMFGYAGACVGGPLAWLFADIFLIPAFFMCKKTLLRRVRPEHVARVVHPAQHSAAHVYTSPSLTLARHHVTAL